MKVPFYIGLFERNDFHAEEMFESEIFFVISPQSYTSLATLIEVTTFQAYRLQSSQGREGDSPYPNTW
jgi:hypothetical protein